MRIVAAMPLVGADKIDKQPLRAQAWVTDDALWYRPPRSDAYRPFTDEDARELAAAFEHHGRAALVPQR